jgi:thiol:disulfide interchange protein DsbA
MLKKITLLLALLALAATAQAATAQAPVYLPGEQYKMLDVPVPTADPQKIEVREFFFYGCPHCYHTQPYVDAWLRTKPKDVDFERTPVLFMRGGDALARAYYIAKDKGILDKTHDALFNAIHGVEQNQPLYQEDALAKWFSNYGIPVDEFKRLFASFGVETQVNQGKALTSAAQIQGVPAFLVDGRYLVLRENLHGDKATFDVIDYLVKMVRSQRAGK